METKNKMATEKLNKVLTTKLTMFHYYFSVGWEVCINSDKSWVIER